MLVETEKKNKIDDEFTIDMYQGKKHLRLERSAEASKPGTVLTIEKAVQTAAKDAKVDTSKVNTAAKVDTPAATKVDTAAAGTKVEKATPLKLEDALRKETDNNYKTLK